MQAQPEFVNEYVKMCCGNPDCDGELPLEPANQLGDRLTCPECGTHWTLTRDKQGLLLEDID